MAVDAITERIDYFDITWPIQIFDEGRLPEISQIDIRNLPKYRGDFKQLKKWLQKLIIQDVYLDTAKKTKTCRLDNEYFDYSYFLRQASIAVCVRESASILTAKKAEIAELIDNYVTEHCFGELIDFTKKENYNPLSACKILSFC